MTNVNLKIALKRAALAVKYRIADGAADVVDWCDQFDETRGIAPTASAIAEMVKTGKFADDDRYFVYHAVKNAVQASFDVGNCGKHSKFGCKIAHIYAALFVARKTDAVSIRRLSAMIDARG